MTTAARADTRIYPTLEGMSEAAAEALVALVQKTVKGADRFTIALSGGNTPRRLYRLLATTYRVVIPWRKVHIFWSDERFVPPDHPHSNYRMAKEALLDHIPIPHDHVHPMPTLLPEIEEAAQAYEETLMSNFPGQWPRFDLILLGMGPDGHVASLFPHNIALEEEARVVTAVRAESEIPLRLTLTLPAINHAANVWFLAAGKEKVTAVTLAFAPHATLTTAPASGVKPPNGSLIWWLDQAAAAGIGR
ncbi:MAG: 6-phosphogluconolactonase [Armatimonadota bacterium]